MVHGSLIKNRWYGMVFTFLKARGISVGKSLVEDDQLELAKKLEK